MSISIASNSSLNGLAQSIQQKQINKIQSSGSTIGEAAILSLSSTSNNSTTAICATDQSRSDTASASSTACPSGRNVCVGCGQCGKTASTNSSSMNNTNQQSSTAADFLVAAAVNAYETNSIII